MTGEIKKFVARKMRPHLRYATDIDGRRPPAAVVTHLIEYVVRSALRQLWDMTDERRCAERVERMMFDEQSELAELARISGFTFVRDVGVNWLIDWSSDDRLGRTVPQLLSHDITFDLQVLSGQPVAAVF